MGRWSFWSWFDVNRPTFDEDMTRKRFSSFRFQWPWSLTFRLQICSPSSPCPALCFHWIRRFYRFPASWKSEARDGRTDKRMRCYAYVAPWGRLRNNSWWTILVDTSSLERFLLSPRFPGLELSGGRLTPSPSSCLLTLIWVKIGFKLISMTTKFTTFRRLTPQFF